MEKVIYFAASVVWRSAAGSPWKRDDRVIDIGLGKYYEPLRKFLVGDQAFPVCMVLHTWISSLEGESLAVCHAPEEVRVRGMRAYQFAIPGINFRITLASHIPESYAAYNTAPAPERFVAVVPDLDRADCARRSQFVWNSRWGF